MSRSYTPFWALLEIRNAATILALLNALLWKEAKWRWTQEFQRSFDQAKAALISLDVLMHYDPSQDGWSCICL